MGIVKERNKFSICLQISQSNRSICEKLRSRFGGGVTVDGRSYTNHYKWRVRNQNAVDVLEEILPFLKCKHEQAFYVIQHARSLNLKSKKYISAMNSRNSNPARIRFM